MAARPMSFVVVISVLSNTHLFCEARSSKAATTCASEGPQPSAAFIQLTGRSASASRSRSHVAVTRQELLEQADRWTFAGNNHKLHHGYFKRHHHRKHASLLRKFAERMPPVVLMLPLSAFSFPSHHDEDIAPRFILQTDVEDPSFGVPFAAGETPGSMHLSRHGGFPMMFRPRMAPRGGQVVMASFPVPERVEDPTEEVASAAQHLAGALQGLEDRLGSDAVNGIVDEMYREVRREKGKRQNDARQSGNESKEDAHNISFASVNNSGPVFSSATNEDGTVASDITVTVSSANASLSDANMSVENITAEFNDELKEMRKALDNSSLMPDIEFPDDFGKAWPEGDIVASASSSSNVSTSQQTIIKDGHIIQTTEHCENGNCTRTTKTELLPSDGSVHNHSR